MSTVVISLLPDTESKLRIKAGSTGLSLEEYIRHLAEFHANGPVRSTVTFDQLLASVRDGFAKNGMSEEELAVEFEAARDEAWQSIQARKTSP